jgi:hypothetical protein
LSVPQIWLSYSELGTLLNCNPEEARFLALQAGADRKKSRDGLSRVKLTATWTELFIQYIRGTDRFERAAEEIRLLPHMNPPFVPERKREQSEAA